MATDCSELDDSEAVGRGGGEGRKMEEEERGVVPVCDFFLRMFRSWVSCPEERRESQGAGRGQRLRRLPRCLSMQRNY
jgi:hypothetical protein